MTTRNRQARLARYRQVLWAALCLAAALAVAPVAFALASANVYKVAVSVADRSETSREAGFQAAMKIVLVRATGKRSADADPTFAPLVAAADRYVQEYRFAPDGRLWVGFDGAAIERWLTQSGAPVWGRTRPRTLVLLTVPNGQSGIVVGRDDASDLKAAIDAEADERGIDLVWPGADELKDGRLAYASVIRADPASLAPIAKRDGADGLLVGHATDLGANASVQWLFLYEGRAGQAAGTVEGVDFAADSYASIFAVTGAYSSVDVEVDGIRDVADYARVQHLLESLTPVSSVAVVELDGDAVHFRLDARGGATPLARTLGLNGLLVSDAAGGAAGGLRFHLNH